MIIENKLDYIITIMTILFIVTFVVALYNFSTPSYHTYDTVDDTGNFSELEETYQQETIDIWSFVTILANSILLQIADAPQLVNILMGFIAVVIYATLIIIGVALIREMIGLT